MKRLLLAFLLLPATVLADPYDAPWVVITTDTLPSSDPALRPVIVHRVDGQPAVRNQVVTTPGPHMVTVDLPPKKGFKLGTQETLDLETSPCMRYHIAAKLDPPTAENWKAVVRYSELIGECALKFKTDRTPK